MTMLAPGPRTPPPWQTFRFITRPHTYCARLKARYGDIVGFHSMLGKGIAVFEAGLAREVFAAPPDDLATVSLVEEIFGSTAVIAVSGEAHRRLRKLLNPPFHASQVKGFLAAMHQAIRAQLDVLDRAARTGEVVVMSDLTHGMALDVILETVFGAAPLDRAEARGILRAMAHAFAPSVLGAEALRRRWYPPWRRFQAARAAFDAWVTRVIRARRGRGDGALGDDVLGVLLAARYEDGAPMEDAEIRDQLVTLLLAGHETSAIAMSWSVHHLAKHPAALAALRAEVDALGETPAPEALVKLRYLNAVASETLRIEPVVTDVTRVCRAPLTLGGRWTLPAGTVVAVMICSILHDPRVFSEPARFRPERFLDRKFSGWEFLPFGGGARRCLGATFAQAELAIAIAELTRRWDFVLTVPDERAVRKNLTMGPQHGVPVRVVARRAA